MAAAKRREKTQEVVTPRRRQDGVLDIVDDGGDDVRGEATGVAVAPCAAVGGCVANCFVSDFFLPIVQNRSSF